MSKTINIEGTIAFCIDGWKKGNFIFLQIKFDNPVWEDKNTSFKDFLKIAPYTIEIEIPESLDLHKAQLTALQEKRKLILAENETRLNAVDNEIAKLMAIEDKS